MSAIEPPSPRRTNPLPASDNPSRAHLSALSPSTPTQPGHRRTIWAWVALPGLLACLLAALAMTMVEPGAGQSLGSAAVPSHTPVDRPGGLFATEVAVVTPAATSTLAPATVVPDATSPPSPTDPAPIEQVVLPPTETPVPEPTATPIPEPTDAPTGTPEPIAVEPPAPTPIPITLPGPGEALDPLTGLAVPEARLMRKPVVIMLDNHPDAAPQTGLNRASMVIEALAEGGITRFESFFVGGEAGTVGPVRSARPYFVEWAYPFVPFYVHCGGSFEAIDLIRESDLLQNVDCFDARMPFWRSDDRVMPHNLYTSTSELWKMGEAMGLRAPDSQPGFPHSPSPPVEERPAESWLSFAFTRLSRSDVFWTYDRDSGSYLRQQWGYWHRDAESGEIVSSANVVVLWTNVWHLPGDAAGRLGTDTIGENTALFMRDGIFEWGYWKRDDVRSPIQFLDGDREPMAFAPGRIWIEVLGIGQEIETSGQ